MVRAPDAGTLGAPPAADESPADRVPARYLGIEPEQAPQWPDAGAVALAGTAAWAASPTLCRALLGLVVLVAALTGKAWVLGH